MIQKLGYLAVGVDLSAYPKIQLITRGSEMKLLCLSGGGYQGLFTASVLAKLEEEYGYPLAGYFDLIAGTSIGGILALALANEVRMSSVVKSMKDKGPTLFGAEKPAKGIKAIFQLRKNMRKPKYKADMLRNLITSLIEVSTVMGDLKHRVIIPSVNVTKGSPQLFKTPHHQDFVTDASKTVVDVALATSAAPTFFQMHTIGSERFVDGGLYANSPDLLALHEATHFLKTDECDISLLSVGTTSTKFSMSRSTKNQIGWMQWMQEQRLTSVMISSQQMLCDKMLTHKLKDRYFRIDQLQSKEQQRELSLDTASESARADLQGLAAAAFQECIPNEHLKAFFNRKANSFRS